MKKKLLFFLLTAVFTLLCAPPEAQAWELGANFEIQVRGTGFNYSDGTAADWGTTYQGMTWNSSTNRYEMKITATSTTVKFKFYFADGWKSPSSTQSLSYTNNPSYSGEFYNDGSEMTYTVTSGETYYIYIKPQNENPTYAFCKEKVPFDFSGNTKPSTVKVDITGGGAEDFDLTYDASSRTWSKEFTAPSTGYINFKVVADGESFGENTGKSNKSDFESWTVNNCVNTSTHYLSDLTGGSKYLFELTGVSGKEAFQWRIVPVADKVATPTFSPAAGKVNVNTELTISCATSGATIYYTIDGTDPTTSSTVYSDSNKPVITSDCTIKAIAEKDGMLSDVASAAYTVEEPVEKQYNVTVDLSQMGSGKWTASNVRALFKNGSTDINTSPGMTGVVNGDIVTFTLTSEVTPTTVVFNNGSWGGSNQSVDFSYISNHTYILKSQRSDGFWQADAAQPVADYNLPYGPNDFAQPKYFLVGSRMGMWRLQPEWELIKQADGSYKVDGGRYMFLGSFAVARVNNFDDYSHHRYTILANPSNNGGIVEVGKTTISGLSDKGRKETKNPSYYNANNTSDKVMKFRYGMPSSSNEWTWAEEDKGVWCKTITLNSSANEISFDIDAGDTQMASERVFTLVGENIYNMNYASDTDINGYETPRASTGWQESWIQYGPNGRPYFDANHEYLYHTAYVPSVMNSANIDFQIKLADNRIFPYTSKAITFVEKDKLDNLKEDKYRDLYQYFIDHPEAVASDAVVKGGSDETAFEFKFGELPKSYTAEDAQWQVYVIRDAWMRGEFKLWNGWGGNSINNEGLGDYSEEGSDAARWNRLSGGPERIEVDGKAVPVAVNLTDINAGADAQNMNKVYVDQHTGANWDAGETITYYNRVILLYNTKQTDRMANSYVLFIQDDTAPVIKAFLEGENNNKAYVEWNLQNVKEGSSAVITDYTITRYRVTDEGNINPTVVKTESGLSWNVEDLKTVTEQTTVHHGEELTPGSYVYHIVVTYKDGEETGTREANSNRIRVLGSELYPELRVEQLVALTENGFTDDVKNALGVEAFEPNKYYLTYRDDSPTADYYVMSATESDNIANIAYVAQIDTEKARAILAHPLNYVWCARFYVRALDYTNYKLYHDRQGLKYSERPEITLTDLAAQQAHTEGWTSDYTGADIKPQIYEVHLASGAVNEYYGAFIDRSGLLLGGQMKADMTYGYGVDAVTEHTAVHSHTVNFTPVVANPFGLKADYEYRLAEFGNPVEEYLVSQGKELSSDFKAEITFATTSSVPGFEGEPITVSADEKRINSERHLDCVISFMRPNLSNNILKNYDIYYTINLTSEKAKDYDPETDDIGNYKPATLTGIYYDVEETSDVDQTGTTGKKRPYQLKISNTHPSGKIYPRFEITNVEYKRLHDGAVSGYSLKPNHSYGELTITAPNKPTSQTSVKEFRLLKDYAYNEDGSDHDSDKRRWFLCGHRDVKNSATPDEGADPDAGDNTNLDLQSPFFVLEIFDGENHEAATGLWKHDHADAEEDSSDKGFWWRKEIFRLGDLPYSETSPSVVATPVYLFHRKPTDEGMTGETVIDLIKVGDARASVKRRAGAANINTEKLTYTEDNGVVTGAHYDATASEYYMLVKGQQAVVEPKDAPVITGIQDVDSDANAEAVYYNLQGIRVSKPVRGEVYIRVQGNTTEKVVF